jgi:protein CpxP
MMRALRRTFVLLLASSLLAQSSAAQGAGRGRLEQQVRERIGRVVQQQLGLTDAETQRLQGVNQRYEGQRRDLVRQEREARMSLRREVLRGDSADQKRTDALLGTLLEVQRKRLDLVEGEQRELARFLTPVQRAKYLALQDQMRRRVEEMRQRAAQRRPGGPGAGRPLP